MSGEDDLDPRVVQTHERVAASVHDLLRTEGLDAVTHTRVAEAAGVGRATLYRHWPDVGALIVHAMRSRHASQVTLPELDDTSLEAAATILVTLLSRTLREDPMVPVMLGMLERAERDPVYAAIREQISAIQGASLDRLLRREIAAGHLPEDLDLTQAKAQLVGPLFFRRLVLGEPMPADQVGGHVAAWLRAIDFAEGSTPGIQP